jgi:hypothetical protein
MQCAMEYPDPVCRAHLVQKIFRSVIYPLKLLGTRRSGTQILQAQLFSWGGPLIMLCS